MHVLALVTAVGFLLGNGKDSKIVHLQYPVKQCPFIIHFLFGVLFCVFQWLFINNFQLKKFLASPQYNWGSLTIWIQLIRYDLCVITYVWRQSTNFLRPHKQFKSASLSVTFNKILFANLFIYDFNNYFVFRFKIAGFKESLQRLEKLHNIEERNQLTKKAEQDDIIKKANELKRLIEEHQRKNKRPD